MILTDEQWRVLKVLAGQTKWLTLPELAQLPSLLPGDSECAGALVDRKLAELTTGPRVRLTPAGQVIAEEPRQR